MFRLFELVAAAQSEADRRNGKRRRGGPSAHPKVASTSSGSVGILPQDSGLALCRVFAARDAPRSGLLDLLFQEFQAIDSLVIRDYYHRYTVDEHSLVTIENLHRLARRKRGTGPPVPRHSHHAGASGIALSFACCFTTSAKACPTRAMWKAAWKR